MDDKKIIDTMNKVFEIINEAQMNILELLMWYANLGYHMGASIAGLTDNVPSIEELELEHKINPSIDTGLMLQGLLMTRWAESFEKKPSLSRFAVTHRNKSKKEETTK